MTSAVVFESVRFSYDGEHDTLDGLDLSIAQGEYLCILGQNGSGKSTLARLIDGLLIPDEGQVRVFGESTSSSDDLFRLRAQVGMVFQNPDDQLVASIVENEVAFGPENLGLPPDEIRQRVSSALEVVGLEGFEKRRVDELSGGEKQRVAIAGALALRPRMLVLDEATAMIDPMGRAGLLRVVRRLNASGMTIVMVTHDAHEAQEADRCVELDRGRIAREWVASGESRPQKAPIPHGGSQAPSPSCSESACRGFAAQKQARAYRAGELGRCSEIDGAACDRGKRPLLRIEHVSYSYEKAPRRRRAYRHREHPRKSTPRWGGDPLASWALDDVTFAVDRGEVFGIAGHTGSGKSTLIHLMGGLKQPTRGSIMLESDSLADKHIARTVCSRIGVSFQYPEYQLFAPTVAEDVAFGPRNLGLPADEVAQRVADALEDVGLPAQCARMSPFELSGGQQRRAALAGVVAMHPEVLILDEPAAGLDAQGKDALFSLIGRMRAAGSTVVIVSHDMDDLARLCDRILVLNQGKRYLFGTPHEVFRDCETLRCVGLDMPCGLPGGGA